MSMELRSEAFPEGGRIPEAHTCEGADASPALSWTGVPSGARSLILICDDPDAPVGNWVHWVVYDLPAAAAGLPEGVEGTERIEPGGLQGLNDFGRIGYGGPAPPPGRAHRYEFTLLALDRLLGLPAGACRSEVMTAAEGHILAEARLTGLFSR